jgi:Type III secretion protein (HpaP)
MHRVNPPPRPAAAARPGPAATTADTARQDRFLRQLGPSPWEEAATADEASDLWVTAFDAAIDSDGGDPGGSPGGEGGDREPQGDEPPPESQMPAEPAPPGAPDPAPWRPLAWAAGANTASGDGRGSDDAPGGPQAVQAAAASDEAPPWVKDMVQQVALLCAEGDPRFQCWSVTLPMDPAVLPDCELRLALSPDEMTLRFRTGSAQSSALVSKHRDTLRTRLQALPASPSAIDIDLE